MTNNVMSFKKIEIVGASKEEAINAANLNFSIAGDATQAYKNWMKTRQGAVTDKDVKQFMVEYLQKKVKCASGVGYIITIESAVADTRERPWTITDVKNEQGKRKFTKVFRGIDTATNQILFECQGTKADAKQAAKDVIANGFHGKMKVVINKEVTEGEPTAFYAEYTPSKAAKAGRWLVFGNENA